MGNSWIDPLGKIFPVEDYAHASTARTLLGKAGEKIGDEEAFMSLLKDGWTRVSGSGGETVVESGKVTPGMLKEIGKRIKSGPVTAGIKGQTFPISSVGEFGTFLRKYGKGVIPAVTIALMLNDLAAPAGEANEEEMKTGTWNLGNRQEEVKKKLRGIR